MEAEEFKWVKDIDNWQQDNILDIEAKSFGDIFGNFNPIPKDDLKYMEDLLSMRTKSDINKFNNQYKGGIYFAQKDLEGNWFNCIKDINDKPIALSPYSNIKYKSLLTDNYNNNLYGTVNCFGYGKSRKASNVVALNGFFVDIETDHLATDDKDILNIRKQVQDYIINYGVNDMLSQNIYNLRFNGSLLIPTYTINSGHGIHLVYLLENQVPVNSEKIRKIWNKIEEYILKNIQVALDKWIGNTKVSAGMVDSACRDASRVLRLPGSQNIKEGYETVDCHVVNRNGGARYDFFELSRKLVPFKPKKKTKKGKITKKAEKIEKIKKCDKNYRTLNYNRMLDFETLMKLRHGFNFDGSRTGFREIMLMLYAKHMGAIFSGKAFIEKLKTFNSDYFAEPLPKKEVLDLIKKYNKDIKLRLNNRAFNQIGDQVSDNYSMTNKHIIQLFNITDDEQSHLRVIHEQKKERRRVNRRQQRRQESETKGAKFKRNELVKKAKEMHENGKSKTDIAKELKISRPTLNKYLKSI